jgi:23S rRNA (uracil1939-C5)-methyltransferase
METCKIAKKCGGCAYINEGYAASLQTKTKEMKTLYKGFKATVHDIVGMDNPYGYRNKVIVAFNKNYQYGLYEEDSHRIIPYDHCLLHDPVMDDVIKQIAFLFKKYRVPLYDGKRGEIRHVLLRQAVVTKQILVTIVSTSPVFKGSKNFCKQLINKCPQVTSVVLNINKRHTSIVLGDQEKILYGKGYVIDKLCGLSFKISSKSFYQINHAQCEALYSFALSLLPKHVHTMYDTYCGIGTIGMIGADKADHVIGIERNRDAIKDANMNKKQNHMSNISFVAADATEYMVKAAKSEKADVIIMDPPRSGSTSAFIKAAISMKPQYILYISCGPETQVRDLHEFQKSGYDFHDVYLFDMFPFTRHVETVVLMSKVKGE